MMVLAACGSGTASSAPAAGDGGDGGDTGETVSLAGEQFTPSTLTIPAGTTVTFTDTANHTVTEGTDGTAVDDPIVDEDGRSEEHTSELQSLMRISYAVFCLKNTKQNTTTLKHLSRIKNH